MYSVDVLPSTAAMSGDATALVTAAAATPNSKETSVNLLPSAAANQLTQGLADASSLLDTVSGGRVLAIDTGATLKNGDKLLNSVDVLPTTAAASGDASTLVTAAAATPGKKPVLFYFPVLLQISSPKV